MRIAHNVAALNTFRHVTNSGESNKKSMGKLASGQRINAAGDDAAGLSISEKMRGQIRGLNMASKNVMDGISLIQTAESALSEQHDTLQRMRELTVQAANDTNVLADREAISREVSRLMDHLDGILENTQYNTKNLFLGLDSEPIALQVGANQGQATNLYIEKSLIPSFGYFVWEAPGVLIGGPGDDQIVDLSSNAQANVFLTAMDKAIEDVSSIRTSLGAYQNRLEHTLDNLSSAAENLTASESRIRDVDMAKEVMEMVRTQVLQQAGQAMFSQVVQQPKQILSLIS